METHTLLLHLIRLARTAQTNGIAAGDTKNYNPNKEFKVKLWQQSEQKLRDYYMEVLELLKKE
tara:strand:+ start:520 stop:708 length:189 start_codon:yes stop_codon:yes gene_type:complete